MNRVSKRHKVPLASLQAANPGALDQLPLPAGTPLNILYPVKDRDTLSSIAGRFQVEPADVLADLPLPAGTPLCIPDHAPGKDMLSGGWSSIAKKLKASTAVLQPAHAEAPDKAPPAELAPDVLYHTQPQDTLRSIAGEFKVSIADLQAANPDVLARLSPLEGSTLNILYQVKDDATLSSIAEKVKVSPADLRAANLDGLADLPLPGRFLLNIPRRETRIHQLDNRNKKEILFKMRENPVMTLYTHPVIYSLSKPGQLPDRLPTNDFTVALLDLLDDAGRKTEKAAKDVIKMAHIIEGIKNLEAEENKQDEEENQLTMQAGVQRKTLPKRRKLAFRLRSLLYAAQLNATKFNKRGEPQVGIEEFQKAVSEWFDDTVARGSVWYKRRMQRIGIACGFLLAVLLNADTIGLSNALWHNAMLRASVLQAAQASANEAQLAGGEPARQQLEALTSLGLPLGWTFGADPADPRGLPFTPEGWIAKVVGLLLTGFAISQGSQLWFDLMNRLLNVRSSALQPASEEHPGKEKSRKD